MDEQSVFINHLCSLVDFWEEASDLPLRDRLEGVVFSILSTLDGDSATLPGYELFPSGDRRNNLTGSLHERFAEACKNRKR